MNPNSKKEQQNSKFRTTYSGAHTVYHNLYHIVFTTRRRNPILTPLLKIKLRNLMKHPEERLGIRILLMNGYKDHLHLLLSIPVGISVSQAIHGIKGYTSHAMGNSLFWQRGYFSKVLSRREYFHAYHYIRNQYWHHSMDLVSYESEILEFPMKYEKVA